MKSLIRSLTEESIRSLAGPEISLPENLNFTVEEPKDPAHGQAAVNAALILAKLFRQNPLDLAARIISGLRDPEGYILSAEAARPGFINFRLSLKWWHHMLRIILEGGPDFGRIPAGPDPVKVVVEYVSANPTGPLHVGHGRGAALGDALARILEFTGRQVTREYYINDAGRQMNILGGSVLVRLEQLKGEETELPPDHYRGEYIAELAQNLLHNPGELPISFWSFSREEKIRWLSRWSGSRILEGIKKDLDSFRAGIDVWFSEQSLHDQGLVEQTLRTLRQEGHIFDEAGAVWFRSEPLGDDKNRVLIKSSGDKTYLAADAAYHFDKFIRRRFDLAVDVWGADHHGYIPRMKAAVRALGVSGDRLKVVLVQLVSLLRGGRPVSMSTRSGEFVTLREVIEEVGTDAARFMFLTRSHESPLDFDLEVAKAQNRDNPVYYVQYVCARIFSLQEKAALPPGTPDLTLLAEPEEVDLITHLAAYPEAVQAAANRLEPHVLTVWLTAAAKLFHQYYSRCRLIDEKNEPLTRARLTLARAVRQAAGSGLNLLGVSVPDRM
jgi:arginyl-tRNA synthetase